MGRSKAILRTETVTNSSQCLFRKYLTVLNLPTTEQNDQKTVAEASVSIPIKAQRVSDLKLTRNFRNRYFQLKALLAQNPSQMLEFISETHRSSAINV